MTLLTPYLKLESVRLDLDIASQKRLFEEASLAFERAYGVRTTKRLQLSWTASESARPP